MVADEETRHGEVRTIHVAGVATDVAVFSAGADVAPADSLAVVFFTGNPGAIHFFVPFLQRVWELSGRCVEVCGVGHAGHSLSTASDTMFGLHEQVEHKINFLTEYYSKGRPVVLVAHSMGAYVALRVVEKMPAAKLNLLHFIGLCPMVSHLAQTRNAKIMMFFVRHAILRNIAFRAADAVSLLPGSVVKKAVSLGLLIEPYADSASRGHTANAVLQIVDSRVLQNGLHLALDEMEAIQGLEPLDVAFDKLGRSVNFVYSPVDGWVAPGAAEEIKKRFPKCCVSLKDEPWLCHMFSLNSRSVERMAACTWAHVRDAMQKREGQTRARL